MTHLPAVSYADTAPHPPHDSQRHTIIRLRGDLSGATTAPLREHLLQALHHSADQLVIDLSAVTHCEPPALAVLVGTQRRARLLGITLRLAAPNPDLAELLQRTGLEHTLTVHPTLAHALAAQ